MIFHHVIFQMRTVLLGLFEKVCKITKKTFLKAVEDETGINLNDNDSRLLLKVKMDL